MLSEIIVSAAKAVGLSPTLLLAVCWVESGHRNIVVHDDGGSPSRGACQIKLATARMFNPGLTARELDEPRTNALYAALYLRHQLKRYRGDTWRAVAAFNRGSYSGPHVTRYAKRVMKAQTEKPWIRQNKRLLLMSGR